MLLRPFRYHKVVCFQLVAFKQEIHESDGHGQGLRSDHLPFPMPDSPHVLIQEWRNLTFMHWEVDPARLAPIPEGLELDLFEGKAYVGTIPFEMKKEFDPIIALGSGIINFLNSTSVRM